MIIALAVWKQMAVIFDSYSAVIIILTSTEGESRCRYVNCVMYVNQSCQNKIMKECSFALCQFRGLISAYKVEYKVMSKAY